MSNLGKSSGFLKLTLLLVIVPVIVVGFLTFGAGKVIFEDEGGQTQIRPKVKVIELMHRLPADVVEVRRVDEHAISIRIATGKADEDVVNEIMLSKKSH